MNPFNFETLQNVIEFPVHSRVEEVSAGIELIDGVGQALHLADVIPSASYETNSENGMRVLEITNNSNALANVVGLEKDIVKKPVPELVGVPQENDAIEHLRDQENIDNLPNEIADLHYAMTHEETEEKPAMSYEALPRDPAVTKQENDVRPEASQPSNVIEMNRRRPMWQPTSDVQEEFATPEQAVQAHEARSIISNAA